MKERGILEEYENRMENLELVERMSLSLEWDRRRKDAIAEYYEDKGKKNLIEEVIKGALETEYTDVNGSVRTLAEELVFAAIRNEQEKGITFKSLEALYKLSGGSKKEVVVQGEFYLGSKARELGK